MSTRTGIDDIVCFVLVCQRYGHSLTPPPGHDDYGTSTLRVGSLGSDSAEPFFSPNCVDQLNGKSQPLAGQSEANKTKYFFVSARIPSPPPLRKKASQFHNRDIFIILIKNIEPYA